MNQPLHDRPPLFWTYHDTPVGRDVIVAVAKAWGIQFPSDYIVCAMQHHGGHPTPECFHVPGWGYSVFNNLLSYDENASGNIAKTYESMKKGFPPGVYPFADDPAGNYLCFDYRRQADAEPVIVLWDHEAFNPEHPEMALYFVCRSFTDLLNQLFECEDLYGSSQA